MPLYCPNCKGMLNQKMNPHCPNCGAEVKNVEKPAKSMAEQVGWKPAAQVDLAGYKPEINLDAVEQVLLAHRKEFSVVLQRLAAAELAIKGLQSQIEGLHLMTCKEDNKLKDRLRKLEISDPCLPACECQPAAAVQEFTPDQMASAIEAVMMSDTLTSRDIRALRAARDHVLRG